MLCEMHSKLISYKSLFDQEDADADEDLKVKSNETAFESMSVDLLPCTLARDLGHLVGNRKQLFVIHLPFVSFILKI